MFECHACFRQTARLLLDGATSTHSHRGLILTPWLIDIPSRRHASSRATISTRPTRRTLPSAPAKPPADDAPARRPQVAVPAITTRPPVPVKKVEALTIGEHRDLTKELQYLTDPLKLADHVLLTLRCAKVTKALELCRLASKTMQCIVSWNHVLNWHMQNGYTVQALKIYNEMKKRAQFPDSYTYVLLLRGLARVDKDPKRRKQSLDAALQIYLSMSAPNSRVQPRIIHTNAMLRVCSVAHDLDGLWSVVSKMPEAGDGSPDHITYTTILTALRNSATDDGGLDDLAALVRRKMRAVDDGRKIWLDVIRKWRAGEVRMDEDLVCAMGDLLLLSPRVEDADSVLDMVKQTTNIDRLIAPLGSPDRGSGHIPRPEEASLAEQALHQQAADLSYNQTPAGKAFKATVSTSNSPSKRTPHTWARPGNAILSILINACSKMFAPKAARDYWDLFTKELMVKPDLANMHAQLRLLGYQRASRMAVQLVTEDMKAADLKPTNNTFRLALQVCARDAKNPNVFNHATDIVNVMKEQQPRQPCLAVLQQYLDLAGATSRKEDVQLIVDNAKDVIQRLHKQLVKETDFVTSDTRSALLSFLQAFVSVTHRLVSDNTLTPDEMKQYRGLQRDANLLITAAAALAEPTGLTEAERDENARKRRRLERRNLPKAESESVGRQRPNGSVARTVKPEHGQPRGHAKRRAEMDTVHSRTGTRTGTGMGREQRSLSSAQMADTQGEGLRFRMSGEMGQGEGRRRPHISLGGQAQREASAEAAQRRISATREKDLLRPTSGKEKGSEQSNSFTSGTRKVKLEHHLKGGQAQRKTKAGGVRGENREDSGKGLRSHASGKLRGGFADSASELAEG